VEIGGVKGKNLTLKVLKIFEEFKEEFEKFNNKKYDPLDSKCNVIFFYNINRDFYLKNIY